MNCLDIQRQLAESSSFSKLGRSVQNHVEQCTECQGFYVSKPAPALKSLLLEAWPEIEPEPRLLATVRHRVAQEMDKPAWRFLQFDFLPSLSFAAGVAALLAVLALPLLWMGSSKQNLAAPEALARAERVQVQSDLAGPFNGADPLVVADSLTSLHRVYQPQIQPGSVVHVIYPFKSEKKTQRTVVHY